MIDRYNKITLHKSLAISNEIVDEEAYSSYKEGYLLAIEAKD